MRLICRKNAITIILSLAIKDAETSQAHCSILTYETPHGKRLWPMMLYMCSGIHLHL